MKLNTAMESPTCRDCYFHDAGLEACVRHAPLADITSAPPWAARWPKVHPLHWCGEWEPNQRGKGVR